MECFVLTAETCEKIIPKLPACAVWEELSDGPCLVVSPAGLLESLKFLRDDAELKFEQLIDICGADYPQKTKRFAVIYNLLSVVANLRLRVKTFVADGDLVPSAVSLFSSAGWFERETFDMYGVVFDGNPDLRRILTDYGFEGHPLRKDFPLTGYSEVRYDPETQKVIYEPVKLEQAFRQFDFSSPWEAAKYVLPGDEKAKG
jgi:NADH-quinone oxidoreductase subunit C